MCKYRLVVEDILHVNNNTMKRDSNLSEQSDLSYAQDVLYTLSEDSHTCVPAEEE